MKRSHSIFALGSLTCVLAASGRAVASEPEVLAETLFRRGKAAMDAGRLDEACKDLSDSVRLDRAGGVELTLAVCYERAGRYASAWVAYLEALSLAQRDGRQDRERIAREHAAKMEQMAPRLTVRAPDEVARLEGLTLFIDDGALASAAWGTELPVDPGDHLVRASAAGRKPWSVSVSLLAAGERKELVVPMLERDAPETPVPAPPAPSASVRPVRHASTPVADAGSKSASPRRVVAYSVGGTGAALLVTGAVFGFRALVLSGDICKSSVCPTSQRGIYDDMHDSATVADITIGAGLALVSAAAVLLLTEPKSTKFMPVTGSDDRLGGTKIGTGVTSAWYTRPMCPRPLLVQ